MSRRCQPRPAASPSRSAAASWSRRPARRPPPRRRRRTETPGQQGRRACGADAAASWPPLGLAGSTSERRRGNTSPNFGTCAHDFVATGIDHVVLAGMGGSSLAPEVIAATAGVRLTVLDTTDRRTGRRGDRRSACRRTVLVVSSKSGGTLETDSHRRVYEQAFRDAGIDPAERIVVVTDPGSPLETAARAPATACSSPTPNVGGRYSALSAFGLVPSALAGVDVGGLLDDAAAMLPRPRPRRRQPRPDARRRPRRGRPAGRDKVVHRRLRLTASWLRRLGRAADRRVHRQERHGLAAGRRRSRRRPGILRAPDRHLVTPRLSTCTSPARRSSGSLGAQFMVWEYATAIAGRVIGIDPFDQPNVQESKDNTGKMLDEAGDGPLPEGDPRLHRRRRRSAHRRSDPARRRQRPAGASSTRCCAPCPTTVTSPSWPISIGTPIQRPRCCATLPRAAHRAAGDVRLGAAIPALHRPVPQGWPADRRVPPDHRRRRARPRDSRADRSAFARLQMAQALGDLRALAAARAARDSPASARSHGRPSRTAQRRGFGSMSPVGRESRATRCATRATGGCRESPGHVESCCSASPATWPARS